MQKSKNIHPFGSTLEALLYPFLLLVVMWVVYLAEQIFPYNFHEFGVLPRSVNGLWGILFMPLIHAKTDILHIVNNSTPIFILLAALIYFYREIALRVFIGSWLITGALVWLFAVNRGAYHVGMSGVIYALAAFLFTSGVIRKFLPLQAISMFVVFFYGGMVWGILPMQEKISWEGHLSGLIIGTIFAFYYKDLGPVRPKYHYEIEKEMGIEPPDFEAMLNEQLRREQEEEEENRVNMLKQVEQTPFIVYHYIPKNNPVPPSTNLPSEGDTGE